MPKEEAMAAYVDEMKLVCGFLQEIKFRLIFPGMPTILKK